MAHRETSLYRNGLKNREYAKEAAQIFGLERATIAEWQGASESRKFAAKPTMAETDSSDYFGICRNGMKNQFLPASHSRRLLRGSCCPLRARARIGSL